MSRTCEVEEMGMEEPSAAEVKGKGFLEDRLVNTVKCLLGNLKMDLQKC